MTSMELPHDIIMLILKMRTGIIRKLRLDRQHRAIATLRPALLQWKELFSERRAMEASYGLNIRDVSYGLNGLNIRDVRRSIDTDWEASYGLNIRRRSIDTDWD